MVLGKTSLEKLINEGNLLVNFDLNNVNSASYDLRIGTIYKDGKIYSEDNTEVNNVIEVKPSEIVTFLTYEIVKIPLDCIGTVFAINKMSSKGFLILNPGHIDPGYNGPLTICAINLSTSNQTLSLKDPIFSLIINQLDKPLEIKEGYKRNYFNTDERKHYEQKMYSKNFQNLSNSIFDLVNEHEAFPEMINKAIKEQRKERWKKILNIFTKGTGLLRSVHALFTMYLFYLVLLNTSVKEKGVTKEQKQKIDSIIKIETIRKVDSIIKVNAIKKLDSI